MDANAIPMAGAFAPASAEQWRGLVERTLKGAGVETLRSEAADGVRLECLYSSVDAAPCGLSADWRRGGEAWDIRALIDQPTLAAAQVGVDSEIEGGARSLLIRVDPSGRAGTALGSPEAMARLLENVSLEATTVALDAGFLGVAAGGWLAAAAKASPAAGLDLNLDPLSAFALAGESPGPIESHLIAGAGLAARLAEPHPRAGFFLASGRVVHEAGGGEAWELAFAMAAAVAYAKAMVRAGMPMDAAFARTTLGLSADADPLITIAKLRAGRLLWSQVTRACGVAGRAVIEVRSSGRMLASDDPWTNLVRLTTAGFAAAVGGADRLVLGAFTDPLGRATPFARRLSRNIQLILGEEANLGRVIDPVGGAWAFEEITDQLAQAAWSRFQQIEAAGGLVEALRRGLLAEAAMAGRSALSARIASGDMKIVGVTDFAQPVERAPAVDACEPVAVAAPDPRLPGPDSHCPATAPIRLEDLTA